MTTDTELRDAYAKAQYVPDPTAKGQWWHFVAAVEDAEEGQFQFGIQCSSFMFGKQEMSHIAITDIAQEKHVKMIRPIAYRPQFNGRIFNLKISAGDCDADLTIYTPTAHRPVVYPSKDIHWGYPSMLALGYVNGMPVHGVCCFDREIFHGRKLLPGETGWVWQVAWLDDGTAIIDYGYTHREYPDELVRTMHHGPEAFLDFTPVGPSQEWRRGQSLAFSYREELCRVDGIYATGDPVVGHGYREVVGYERTPDI
jgi:hypothetical protein